MAEPGPAEHLFSGLAFTIVPQSDIPTRKADELCRLIREHGGRYIEPLSDGSIDFPPDYDKQPLYAISTHAEFPQYEQCLEQYRHVVRPSWVEQSVIKCRLAQARQHSPDPSLVFQDVVVCFGDLPQGDKDAITAGVISLGGQYSSSLTKLVTHVVSMSEDHEKIRVIREKQLHMKVVLPHWFNDCLLLGKKIDEQPYILPDPPILSGGSFHARRIDRLPDLEGAMTATPGDPPPLTPPASSQDGMSEARQALSVFSGKTIFFCSDLKVQDELARTHTNLTRTGGGSVVTKVSDADIYIGHYREGAEYVKASQEGKIVGNLAWFYQVLRRNRWTNPTNKLMHYPVPRAGIPGFRDMKICLSNYTGDARMYLENIIEFAGGQYTKTLKQENTHLITAHKKSEKCNAAEEWNINIINHLWLEESYACCAVQSLTHPRYTTFPPRSNLSEIVGQTPIDMEKIVKLYFPDEKQLTGPSSKVSSSRKIGNGYDTSTSTPTAQRFARMMGEEDVPSAKRASALKAKDHLKLAADDIALYNKQLKRKGGITHGGKRGDNEMVIGADNDDEDGQHNEETPRANKKQKKAPEEVDERELPPVQHRLMVTGDDRWKSKTKREADDRKTLRLAGIELVQNPLHCTVLCARKILRTKNFVVGIAAAPEIVNIDYLDTALKTGTAPTPLKKFRLVDTETEKKWTVNLADSLARAKENDRKLLRGWSIYVTEGVAGGFATYKEIIEANGGTAIPYRGRTGIQLPRRRLGVAEDPDAGAESQNQGGDEELDYVYLVSGDHEDEVKHWATFDGLAERQELVARIVKTDWLLNAAMAQQVVWDAKWEHGNAPR